MRPAFVSELPATYLGLALLGYRQSLQRIRGMNTLNMNREAKPLALASLDAGEQSAQGLIR
ncbi:hypothetical protein D7Y13_28420 [Corallococcus praedator]|uniref:Uncharacterized protein n=2 Tax=Corallococcus praedator TaxID=2316724 RepID=A0ABX9QBM0_9BACT|nr:hypothetical protein [Corallococcus sp. CA031C]RKH98991.1 hypothetical protein D7Y13_28420 [Corallococcus praedator]